MSYDFERFAHPAPQPGMVYVDARGEHEGWPPEWNEEDRKDKTLQMPAVEAMSAPTEPELPAMPGDPRNYEYLYPNRTTPQGHREWPQPRQPKQEPGWRRAVRYAERAAAGGLLIVVGGLAVRACDGVSQANQTTTGQAISTPHIPVYGATGANPESTATARPSPTAKPKPPATPTTNPNVDPTATPTVAPDPTATPNPTATPTPGSGPFPVLATENMPDDNIEAGDTVFANKCDSSTGIRLADGHEEPKANFDPASLKGVPGC